MNTKYKTFHNVDPIPSNTECDIKYIPFKQMSNALHVLCKKPKYPNQHGAHKTQHIIL